MHEPIQAVQLVIHGIAVIPGSCISIIVALFLLFLYCRRGIFRGVLIRELIFRGNAMVILEVLLFKLERVGK